MRILQTLVSAFRNDGKRNVERFYEKSRRQAMGDPVWHSLYQQEIALKYLLEKEGGKGTVEVYDKLYFMWRDGGFPVDARRVLDELREIEKQGKTIQAQMARAEAKRKARQKIEVRKNKKTKKVIGQDWNVEIGSGNRQNNTTDFEINPKYEGHAVEPSLCEAELAYIACPPQNVPTLFEEKALKFKRFWLIGRPPLQASSTLGKGYGEKLGRHYFKMFEVCSDQRPSSPTSE